MKILLIGAAGYIGSALHPQLLAAGHSVDGLDAMWFGCPSQIGVRTGIYQKLSAAEIAKYDCVCLLAAHSSVAMSMNDFQGALDNNLYGPIDLYSKLSSNQIFIYASSSSVYSGSAGYAATEEAALFKPQNVYDFSKGAFDNYLALQNGAKYFGLRFGTVNGASPSIRRDLMINSMTYNALTTGKLQVSNGHVHRPILGTADLSRAVVRILENPVVPGLYNLASFNARVEEIARTVAQIQNAQIEDRPNTPTYDFSISAAKFENTFAFKFQETTQSIVTALARHYNDQSIFARKTDGFTSFKEMSRLSA